MRLPFIPYPPRAGLPLTSLVTIGILLLTTIQAEARRDASPADGFRGWLPLTLIVEWGKSEPPRLIPWQGQSCQGISVSHRVPILTLPKIVGIIFTYSDTKREAFVYSIYCETGMGGDMRREFMAGHPELGFVYVSEHQNLGLVTANAKSIAANEDRRCIVRMREDEGYAPVAAFDGNGEIEDGDF